MNEIFIPIRGYEDRYIISNFGRIKSLKYRGHIGKTVIMQGFLSKDGYPSLSLTDNEGKIHSNAIHRLVIKHFVPNPKNLETCNHIDGNKQNNRIDNLEWATREYQMNHAVRIGLFDKSIKKQQKLSFEDSQKIKEEYKTGNFRMRDLAEKWGIGYGTINSLLNNRTYNKKL